MMKCVSCCCVCGSQLFSDSVKIKREPSDTLYFKYHVLALTT